MSNTNYIQETETIQQIKKFWSYTYQLRHIPTGLLYVGSRSKKSVLKKEKDCYTDKYLGSSCREEGPFSAIDTKTNPQDYEKTVLKVFYDEDANRAWKDENGDNGLIMTYWNLYGQDKVLNQHCFLSDGSKVFSRAGTKHSAATKQKICDTKNNKSEEQKNEIIEKFKNTVNNKPEEEKAARNQKHRDTLANKSKEQKEEKIKKFKNTMNNKTEEEKEEINQKISEGNKEYQKNISDTEKEERIKKFKNTMNNKTEEEKATIAQKQSNAWNNKTEEQKEEINQKQSKSMKGKNKGKNPYAKLTEEQKTAAKQKMSDKHKDRITITNGQNEKKIYEHELEYWLNLGWTRGRIETSEATKQKRSEKSSLKYYCPYDISILRIASNMAWYIKKYYPNEKQWPQFTKEEKQSYLIIQSSVMSSSSQPSNP